MCKALEKGMTITDMRLESKTGGKSGDYERGAGAVANGAGWPVALLQVRARQLNLPLGNSGTWRGRLALINPTFSFCPRGIRIRPHNSARVTGELKMRLRLSQDARPQAMTLLIAATISCCSGSYLTPSFSTYPFRIFVTFIHEGGHAIAALLTGNSVASLSVATNASGETYTTQGGLISQIFISSAGYLGSMAFGALLLVLIRKAVAARIVLLGCGILVFAL